MGKFFLSVKGFPIIYRGAPKTDRESFKMGISNLFKFLDKCVHPANIADFGGKTIAIDMPCWIHRAAIADAQNIVLCTNVDASHATICDYVEKRLRQIMNKGIKPIAVFDGEKLVAKKATNDKRRKTRESAKDKAREALKAGDTMGAYRLFCQAIRISPEMNESVKALCAKRGVPVITAPYEADAQLAYLSRANHIDGVISEDSDLIIYGVAYLIAKLNDSGNCSLVKASDLNRVSELDCFDKDKLIWLRFACILQGCDYYPTGLPGLGLKMALKMLQKAHEDKQFDLEEILSDKRRGKYATAKAVNKWSASDLRGVLIAEQCFRYQLIANVKLGAIEPLEPYPFGLSEADFPHCGVKGGNHTRHLMPDITNKHKIEQFTKKTVSLLVVPKSRQSPGIGFFLLNVSFNKLSYLKPKQKVAKTESKKRSREREDTHKPATKRMSTGVKLEARCSSTGGDGDNNSSDGSELEFEKHVKREHQREKITGKKPSVTVLSSAKHVVVKSSYWQHVDGSQSSDNGDDDDGIFRQRVTTTTKKGPNKSG